MKIPRDNHETDQIREFENKGYTADYKMEGEKLLDLSSRKTYSEKDIRIVDQFRYEGMSNPDDMSILYIIETIDGGKGTILIPYGPNAVNDELVWFLKKVPIAGKPNK